jgi:hypothetical protein
MTDSKVSNGGWQPTKATFERSVEELLMDDRGMFIMRPDARLYLYFAGHGFTSDKEVLQSASLVGADTLGSHFTDIPGTLYAEAFRKAGLFGEIVLIMDCCRTLMRLAPYGAPQFIITSAGNQEAVSLLSIYPVPKDGRAQERLITDAGPEPVGVMTYSLLKALDEMPPDILGRVSDSALDQYLTYKWKSWFPDATAPEKPRMYPPTRAENRILFNSGRILVEQAFSIPVDRPSNYAVTLSGPELGAIRATFTDRAAEWKRPDFGLSDISVPLAEPGPDNKQTFTLQLLPTQYRLDFEVDPQRDCLKFTPGNERVEL